MRENIDLFIKALGFEVIAGIDEAGRGPLAGPVVSCAIVLKPDTNIAEVNDSKALTAKKRTQLLPEILKASLSCAIGISWNEEIDEINILKATMRSMSRAANNLSVKPSLCLIDGRDVPEGLPSEGLALIKGDSRSLAIASASIVAKVMRDEIMEVIHEKFPEYGFDKHKGYPTKLHYQVLDELGPTKYHRLTFRGVQNKLF